MQKIKRVHVIGICGVATSALAIAFHKAGIKVTGSDKGFYPPVSDELQKAGIEFYAGWHPEKMITGGIPDIVIVATASGSTNPETMLAKEKNLKMYSFAEAIGEFFTRKNTIVCSGTWGKTSSSAILSYIMKKAGYNPSYMFGGISLSHDSSAEITDSEWSVLEGDEYKSSPTDLRPKFSYYKPTHLLMPAVSWDHADLYPTEESYFAVFSDLLKNVKDKGFVVGCTDNIGLKKLLENSGCKFIGYQNENVKSNSQNLRYTFGNIIQNIDGISFNIFYDNKEYKIKSPMIGKYQAENITGCFAMATEIGISPEITIQAISEFNGLKRRLEKRLPSNNSVKNVSVFDDIAHSPEKSTSVLANLREIFKGKIFAIFEPNTGGRRKEALIKYDFAMKDADVIIIPKLTKLKSGRAEESSAIEGDELANVISKTHNKVLYIEDDEKLVDFLATESNSGDCIVFLGAHGFRGMIDETVKRLKK